MAKISQKKPMALFSRLSGLRSLAVPSVCLLICFLAYSSQYLFYRLDPGPLTTGDSLLFNSLVAAVWLSYERACRTDPGRLPRNLSGAGGAGEQNGVLARPGRWCKKCEAVKPPRAHHCRQCGRCIPKMDHHCPWTSNCVSHTTFPHFFRFVFYTVLSLMLLMYHLYVRLEAIWQARNLPSYLGPSTGAMAHLFILTLITILLLFALTILLVTAANSLLTNTTMIETWEIERHAALLERSRYLGGYVQGPGGRRVQIVKQEFPYDIGFWRNLVQGMGSKNILAWFFPIGGGPDNGTAWGPWEKNGFEDPNVQWPPPDPEKLGWEANWKKKKEESPFIHPTSDEDRVQAFKRRQEADYRRWERSRSGNSTAASNPRASETGPREHLHENSADEVEYESEDDSGGQGEYEEGIDGYPGWTSSDGSRLRDFGVDEEAEVIVVGDEEDDDDVPLGVLLRRRRAQASAATSTGE